MTNIKLMSTDAIDSFVKDQISGDSSDSEFSYDSEASDCTYAPSSGDESTFETAHSQMSSIVQSPELLLPMLPVVKKEIKPERPASRASQSRSNTPVPVQSPYNLRSRRNNVTPLNAIVKHESPEAFGRIVKQMERITRHNAQKIIGSVNASRVSNCYSSDDE